MGTSARGTMTGAVLLGLCVGLTGCGEGVAGGAPAGTSTSTGPAVVDGLVPPGYAGSFELVALVVQGDTGGPAACIGAQSDVGLPPGARPCGGLELTGWDWEAVPHTTAADGVRRGTYRITGTVDPVARTMTITAPAVVSELDPPPEDEPDYSTRCPEPAGGWVAPDPSLTTPEAEQALYELAPQLDGYAGLYVDQSRATSPNDPLTTVVNVLTVGDVAATEAALREVWGGPLCVSPSIRSEAELMAPQDAVGELDGFMSSGPNVFTGRYEVEVLIARSEDQAALDAEFGEGVVHLTGLLTPVG